MILKKSIYLSILLTACGVEEETKKPDKKLACYDNVGKTTDNPKCDYPIKRAKFSPDIINGYSFVGYKTYPYTEQGTVNKEKIFSVVMSKNKKLDNGCSYSLSKYIKSSSTLQVETNNCYDSSGYLLKKTREATLKPTDKNESTNRKYYKTTWNNTFEYNKNNELIETKLYYFHSYYSEKKHKVISDSRMETYDYTYFSDGYKKTEQFFKNDILEKLKEFSWNKDKNEYKVKTFAYENEMNPKLIGETIVKIKENGSTYIQTIQDYDTEGNKKGYSETIFDLDMNPILERNFDDGVITRKTEFFYKKSNEPIVNLKLINAYK